MAPGFGPEHPEGWPWLPELRKMTEKQVSGLVSGPQLGYSGFERMPVRSLSGGFQGPSRHPWRSIE